MVSEIPETGNDMTIINLKVSFPIFFKKKSSVVVWRRNQRKPSYKLSLYTQTHTQKNLKDILFRTCMCIFSSMHFYEEAVS